MNALHPLIPVTVVTGFLGSGKTTLLRGLIEHRQTRRLALLINEFGEVSIDGALVRDSSGNDAHIAIHDFAHGLIAYGEDELFLPTMKAIAARRANVDHVLIETSGLALPTAVMDLLQSSELTGDFILDATISVVDTPLLLSGQFERSEEKAPQAAVASLFEQQIEYADVVVLNKIDGMDEDALLQAEAAVRQRAPKVRFLELAWDAKLDIRLALGLRLHQAAETGHEHKYYAIPSMPSENASPLAMQSRLNGHTHSGLGSHTHGLATHKHFHEQDPGWQSFVLRSQVPQQAEALKTALMESAKAEPILRVKGYVRTDDGSLLVQGVRTGVVVNPAEKAAPKSELVFIGYHPSRTKVAALMTELTGTVWK